MTFTLQLKTIRTLRGLTQEQLAEKTGVPNTYISMMETGKIIPVGDWEARIKAALDWPDEAVFAALLPAPIPAPATDSLLQA